ncbi:MAG: hypothetical protein CW716_12930 [Candidatus Bathyarchaeum sp.]|nr:MAG: hypothetical protein CW716_12930 [Candidatus Bathyarchaeum sp.]
MRSVLILNLNNKTFLKPTFIFQVQALGSHGGHAETVLSLSDHTAARMVTPKTPSDMLVAFHL